MQRVKLLALAGAVAGFAGVLVFQSQPAMRTAPTTPVTAAGPPTRPTASSAAAHGAKRNATGTGEQYGYGMLAVRVTVRGNRISNVTVPTLQTADPLSQQIASQVIPMLRNEVLAAQSARINAVTGATYTTEAYAISLQSALDKLHVK